MYSRLITFFLTLCVVLSSCSDREGKDISEYKDLTTGDSLLYYYLQYKALEYWERAENDTTLKSAEQRERFLEGVEKGISLVTDDENYNKGLRLGVRLANNLRDFEKKYNVDLKDEIMIASLRNGLNDENNSSALDDQREFYRLLDKMKEILKTQKRAAADKSLQKAAAERGMKKVIDKLYYKNLRNGTGPLAKSGDIINISVDYEKLSGDNLGLPTPVTVTVGGDGVPKVMDAAYQLLNQGASASFVTTAYSLFGSRTPMMSLEEDDVIIVNMILNGIVRPTDENHPGSAVVPRL